MAGASLDPQALSDSCRSAALQLAQHGQAIQEVIITLQAALTAASTLAATTNLIEAHKHRLGDAQQQLVAEASANLQNSPAISERPILDSADQENVESRENHANLKRPSVEESEPQTEAADPMRKVQLLPASSDLEPKEMVAAEWNSQVSQPDPHLDCAEKAKCQLQESDCKQAKPARCGCGHECQQQGNHHNHNHNHNHNHSLHNNSQKGNGKGWTPWPDFWKNEPRYDGWTQAQWQEWTKTQCGSRWISNKRIEAERIAEFMVQAWGLETLKSGSGVIDVGGDPGWLASALLQRGVPVTVLDPSWGLSGKGEISQDLVEDPRFTAIRTKFDEIFVAEHKHLLDESSAIVSLYGDEATAPCLEYAAVTGKPCAVMPCNECVRFWPPHQRNYDSYAQALQFYANQKGGRMQRATLQGAPFSWVLIVQLPSSAEGLHMQEELQRQHQHMQQMQQMRMQNWKQMQMQQNSQQFQQHQQQFQQHQLGPQQTQQSQCQQLSLQHQHETQRAQPLQCPQQSQQHEHGLAQAQQLREQPTQELHVQQAQTNSTVSTLCKEEQSSDKKKKTKNRQKK